MAGTLGAVVEAGGTRHILSNNHVLANENRLPIGTPIFQPGLLDGGDVATDQIAELARFIAIDPDDPNVVDCAIAEVLDAETVCPTFLPRVGRLESAVPIRATAGMQVHKTGRTTGYTRGIVVDDSADVKVAYAMGSVIFLDQVLIRNDGAGPFSEPGDSGAVIVDRTSRRASGLLFAGSRQYTIANQLADALEQLGVGIVASP